MIGAIRVTVPYGLQLETIDLLSATHIYYLLQSLPN